MIEVSYTITIIHLLPERTVSMPALRSQVWLQIAGPMIVMGLVLFGLGAVAAWKVHQIQQTNDQVVAKEVQSMLTVNDLHANMREIGYQINLYLRSPDSQYLAEVARIHLEADRLLNDAHALVRTGPERELIARVDRGYYSFFQQFEKLNQQVNDHDWDVNEQVKLVELADTILTRDVLRPLQDCADMNRDIAARASASAQQTAQTLKMGLLTLGICGGAAGLLLGVGIARAVGQSMIRLDISLRSAAVRLGEVNRPVILSHTTDLSQLGSSINALENEITKAVDRLQQSERDLLRAEQLAQVGQLAAGLAHELRNPLMPMKMLVQSALERNDGLTGRALLVLNEEIIRLEKSIQSLLDFARPPRLEKSVVSIVDLVHSTVDLVSARACQQNVELHTVVANDVPHAWADPVQIRQVLLNLILNAFDSLPDGGIITLRVDTRSSPLPLAPSSHLRESSSQEIDSTPIPIAAKGLGTNRTASKGRVTAGHQGKAILREDVEGEGPQPLLRQQSSSGLPGDKWVMIQISDNGPGFPAAIVDHAFDPFVTSKETGSGLGLSICQRIVYAHQGEIEARNLPGGGAEVTMLLPIKAEG